MSSAIDDIATFLKNARTAKGLTQRALSRLAGLPQSHISKIERGAVDLRVTSLVELARALDLELTLVPRKCLPAINSIVRSTRPQPSRASSQTRVTHRELSRLRTKLNTLLHEYPANPELAQFRRAVIDLKNLRFIPGELEELREANSAIDLYIESRDPAGLRHALGKVRNLRDAAMHSMASARTDAPRPAYELEDDSDVQ